MKTSSISVVLLALSGVLPILSGCPKKEDPQPIVFDAAPPPPPPSAEPVDLAPLEDAGVEEEDADADAGKPKPGVNVNVARVRQCCNAISAQGKALGASPEGATLMGIAASCNAAAAQLSPNSTGVELAAVRQVLKAGKALPAICSGL